MEMFRRAHAHKGSSIVEVFQNCNVFNDGAWEGITKKQNRNANLISLEHGKPIRFGADDELGVIIDNGVAKVASIADVGEAAVLVHDEGKTDPSTAFMLSRLARGPFEPTPVGVFRAVDRIEYATSSTSQLAMAHNEKGSGDLKSLLRSRGTWQV